MSKKGLSIDEKRNRILDIFHSTVEVFQLKDVEKLASKKGVVLQTVKDVLIGLIDDGLVKCEKIGTSNHYWSFPQDAYISKSNRENDLNSQVKQIKENILDVEERIRVEEERREETEIRQKALEEVEEVQKQIDDLTAVLNKWKSSGPMVFEQLTKEVKEQKCEIIRLTDNIIILSSWYRKMGISEIQLKEMFNIDDDMDYD